MERISEEDDICFKKLPLHLQNYKTGPRVYTSTCVFHQYGRGRVDEKRMLLSLMASTHGKQAGWEGKSGLELQVNLRITQVRGASDGLVVFSDDGEHPQNLKIWKKDTVYNAAQINVLPSCLSTVHLKCSASANLRKINLLSGGIKAKDPISTGLSRDRTPFIPPLNALVVANHAVCHLAKKSFWKELARDEGSMAQVHCSDSVCLFSYSVAKGQNHSWILDCICSSISELKHNKMAVSLDDALGPGRGAVEHSKSACHSFLFCLGALKCTIKSLHD